VPCLKAWADSLGGVNYPLLSDFWPHGAAARQYHVLRDEGHSERALFIVDRQGIIRYIDVHEFNDQPSNETLLKELRRIDPEAAASEPPPPEAVELPRGGIVMYCTKWCSDCKKARAWLSEHNVDYTEIDVSGVPGAAQQVRAWADGRLVTPIFDVDGTILVNPDLAELQDLL
jgi:glutaredoxin